MGQRFCQCSLFCLAAVFYLLFAPAALAEVPADITGGVYNPQIMVEFGGIKSQGFFSAPSGAACPPGIIGEYCVSVDWLGQYFGAIYQYGVGLAAMLAAIMIMIGGFLWLASAGSPERVKTGKELIIGALSGLVLALFSYLILNTINPDLVKMKSLVVSAPVAVTPTAQPTANGNTLPAETKANEAVAAMIMDCQQKHPDLACDQMVQISQYSEYEGTYEYRLAGNEDLYRFLHTEGKPSAIKKEFLARQGIVEQVVYNGASYSLYGDKPGERYWRVVKIGDLPGMD